MPRINHIKRAKASTKQRLCLICGHEVQVGEAYKYIEKRTGFRSGSIRLIYCYQHSPRPSHMASGRTAEFLGLQEGIEEDINSFASKLFDERGGVIDHLTSEDIDNLRQIAETAEDNINTLREEIEESVQNIENGFGHSTPNSEAMTETADGLMEWQEKFRTVKDDLSGDSIEEGKDPIEEIRTALEDVPEFNLVG